MKLASTGWCWNGVTWVALITSADEQLWFIEEAPLLIRVANGDKQLAPGLFGTANGIPPWGTLPDELQIARGRRWLHDAQPLATTD